MDSPADRVPSFGLAFAWGGALLFVFALSLLPLHVRVYLRGKPADVPGCDGDRLGSRPVHRCLRCTIACLRASACASRSHESYRRHSNVPFYVWIASLLFIGVCALWRPVDGVPWQVPPPFGWLLYGALVTGAWLSVRSAGVIDIWELAGVRAVLTPNSQRLRFPNSQTGANPRPQTLGRWPNEDVGSWEFKTTGPYGVVRHPIYLGWFLMVFGVPTMTNTRLVFALVSCAYLLMAIPLEERSLRLASAGKYDEYIRVSSMAFVSRGVLDSTTKGTKHTKEQQYFVFFVFFVVQSSSSSSSSTSFGNPSSSSRKTMLRCDGTSKRLPQDLQTTMSSTRTR